jgi:hypothetical protein
LSFGVTIAAVETGIGEFVGVIGTTVDVLNGTVGTGVDVSVGMDLITGAMKMLNAVGRSGFEATGTGYVSAG